MTRERDTRLMRYIPKTIRDHVVTVYRDDDGIWVTLDEKYEFVSSMSSSEHCYRVSEFRNYVSLANIIERESD